MSHTTTMTLKTPLGRTSAFARGLAMAALAAGAWALSAGMSTAHAKDVYFSVGVNSPGVSVGVSNLPPPRVVHRRPVYVQQAPVIVHPGYRPVYHNNYGYVRPVVVAPQPVYVQGGGWGYRGDRYDRRDDRRYYRNDRRHGNYGHGHGHRNDHRKGHDHRR